MKILIVGSNRFYSIERHFYANLRRLNIDVKIFCAPDVFSEYFYKSLFNKIMFRLGFSNIYSSINKKLLGCVEEIKPSVIIVFKGMEIFPDTIDKLKNNNRVVINYNPDNPFLFSGKGSGNENVIKSLSKFDGFITYDRNIEGQLISQFGKPVLRLPFGYSFTEADLELAQAADEIKKVCFIGNPDSERAEFLKKIANYFPICLYGNNWTKFINHPHVTIHPEITGAEYWVKLRQYRLQLNLMRLHNPESHNMRSFEVPGIGGVLLAPETIDHHEFFRVNRDVYTFRDISDCLKKIEEIMALTNDEVVAVRQSAFSWSKNKRYDYAGRTDQMIQFLQGFGL